MVLSVEEEAYARTRGRLFDEISVGTAERSKRDCFPLMYLRKILADCDLLTDKPTFLDSSIAI